MSSPSRRSWYPDNLRDVMTYWEQRIPARPWHAGRTVGRTVYRGDGPDDLIGVMDKRDYAAFVCCMRNLLPDLTDAMRTIINLEYDRLVWQHRSTASKLWEVLRGRA